MICIIRRTYGFGHKVWEISLRDFSSATSIDKPNVRRAIRALISKQMITANKITDSNRVSYGLQKDYGKWKLRGLSVQTVSIQTVSDQTKNVVNLDNETVSDQTTRIHTQERNKERIKKGRKTPLPENSNPRVKEFLSWWDEEYRKRFDEPYVFNGGKEGKLIKERLHQFDLPKLKDLVLHFFQSNDPWVQEHGGYTIGIFASQINKLVSTSKGTQRQPQPKEFPI